MEAVAYFAKEPHSDHPKCACPVLTSFMITLNDRMADSERQLLKPYIHKLIGTRDGNAQKRADILAWASIVEFTPHSLKLIGLNNEANALINLKKFDWSAASNAARAAHSAASAAYSAASAASAADSAAYRAASAAYSAASAASAAHSAAYSAAYSAASAARSAASAADSAAYRAARSAADSAASAANAASSETQRLVIIKMALKALDRALAVK